MVLAPPFLIINVNLTPSESSLGSTPSAIAVLIGMHAVFLWL